MAISTDERNQSETPETDMFRQFSLSSTQPLEDLHHHLTLTLASHEGLERRLSLAQTEIKGHMRVAKEAVERADLMERMRNADARVWSDELQALRARSVEAQARIAELRDAYTELESDHKGMIDAWIDAEEREQKLKERVAELEKAPKLYQLCKEHEKGGWLGMYPTVVTATYCAPVAVCPICEHVALKDRA